MQAAEILQSMSGYVRSQVPDTTVKFGVIDPSYTVLNYIAGTLPKVTFDGESTMSGKLYPVIGDYIPYPSERVMLIPCGRTYAIVGAVAGEGLAKQWRSYGAGGATVLTAVTTNPTQGSSTYTAEYAVVTTNLVKVRITLLINTGGGWNAGSGDWRFMLPPGFTQTANSSGRPGGVCWINKSGIALRQGVCYSGGSTTYFYIWVDNGSSLAAMGSGGLGGAWATNDVIQVPFEFEPA